MRTIVDKCFGNYQAKLKIVLLEYPLREVRIIVDSPVNINPDDGALIGQSIVSACDFVQNNDNPWENNYG